MSQEFKIEIISPDSTVYSGKVDEVILPCFEGQVTILTDHIPFITFLRPGLIEVGKSEKFYTEDGTVEFAENNLLILSEKIKNLKDINTEQKNLMIREAESDIANNRISDKQRYIINHKIDILKHIN